MAPRRRSGMMLGGGGARGAYGARNGGNGARDAFPGSCSFLLERAARPRAVRACGRAYGRAGGRAGVRACERAGVHACA